MNAKIKSLFNYIFPAIGGLFVTYLYNVADGIFVGHGVGAAALGAVNIGVPFITFTVAIAAMFPMGGATVVAIRMGRGDKDGANRAFTTAFFTTLAASVLLTLIGAAFSQQIVDFSGADKLSDEMREMSSRYLFYYSIFSIPALMSVCLSTFVRNDGAPTLAFVGMCVGAAANIFLDWLFIFPLQTGVVGAAVASGLGQICSVIVLLTHFTRKKGDLRITACKIDFTLMKKICKRGAPEAVTQLTTPVTALCYNLALASLIGDIGVSAFSVLSFIYSLANAVLSGVAQGLQPIWGQYCGKKDDESMEWFFRGGIIINTVLAVAIYGALFLLDEPIVRIFNQEPNLVRTAAAALPSFALFFIPMAYNLIHTAFLFSTKRTGASNAIAVARGVVLRALAIFLMPAIAGTNAIWIAPFVAETVTLAIAIALKKTSKPAY